MTHTYTVRRQELSQEWNEWALKWTTMLPTEPGWYWAAIYRPDVDDIREIVRVVMTNGRFTVQMVDNEEEFRVSTFTHWLGPLPVPGLPVDSPPEKA